jgi:hypothetical protein
VHVERNKNPVATAPGSDKSMRADAWRVARKIFLEIALDSFFSKLSWKNGMVSAAAKAGWPPVAALFVFGLPFLESVLTCS